MIFNQRYNHALIGSLFLVPLLFLLALGTVYSPELTSAITFLFACFVLIALKPLAGLMMIAVLVHLSNITIIIDSPSRIANETVNLATIPISLIYMIYFPRLIQGIKHSDRYVKAIMILMLFLFGWAGLSLFWTHDIYHGINTTVTFLICLLIVQMFLFLIRDKESLFKILNIFPLLGVALGIVLVISRWYSEAMTIDISQDAMLSISVLSDQERPGGFAPPDFAATVMNIFIFIIIALTYRARVVKKFALLLVILFLTFCCFLTGSKGAAGSLFIGLMLLILFMPFFRKYLIRMCLALIFVMSPLIILGGKVLVSRIKLVIEKGIPLGGVGERLEWWGIGFDKIFDTFGLGLGAGGFLKYIDPVPGAHSFYFSLLFDLGVIGFSIFLIMIIYLITYLRKALSICRDKEMIFVVYCFIANLVACGLQALVQMDFQTMFAWFLLGLTLVVLKIALETADGISEAIKYHN